MAGHGKPPGPCSMVSMVAAGAHQELYLLHAAHQCLWGGEAHSRFEIGRHHCQVFSSCRSGQLVTGDICTHSFQLHHCTWKH